MTGKLYLVATPIGNLGDLSPRAAEVLAAVDFIAAEDTRVSVRLLNHLGIKKPMISYFQHNLRQRGQEIAARIEAGESCAIITDAGMPCISDPGEDLVALCAERGIEVVGVPGANAAITALALSGLPTARFCFEGFLSVNKRSRRQHLQELAGERRTMIFYEAPHKLQATLNDLLSTLGDRRVSLAREITKLHEEVRRTTLAQAAEYYSQNPPRGEFVLVVEGAPAPRQPRIPIEQAVQQVVDLQKEGLAASEAARQVAHATGYKKSELYRLAGLE